MSECMYQQNTSPKGCYYENKDHSVIFIECDTADCYYKQLKRLQAENDGLKSQLDFEIQKKETENERLKEQLSGKTFFCENCEKLVRENERLKNGIKHYQRGMYKIISVATECRNSKQWNYEDK